MAVVAIPLVAAAQANAESRPPQPVASSLHLDFRVDGMRAGIHVDRHGVSQWFSDKHLGIKQSASIGC
ncbi:hypothetical protein LWC34_04610 [Kibdelosporangium philippinense]|uniref:Uncharacterized protein n=1 Tax=Kibdelosporangium philippinense TaxID=211113 RepID=A0ABS8Z5R2_9PSEU|nr:hypothetical protein [Kibdelosporangium philippinense]MCE7002110.1 hypothetical protein [Kibdelosporangium philippinense]